MAIKKDSLAKILGRMSDVEHQKIEKNLFALIYGGFGVGKTTLEAGIAQAIKGDGEVLFLDSAQGAAALDNIPKLKRSMRRIPVIDPRDLQTIAAAMKAKKAEFRDVSVLLLDEVDAWFEKILHMHVREKYGVADSADLPDIEGKDYNAPTAIFINTLNTFLAVENLHVIMIAHEQERKKGSVEYTSPSLPPKLMRGINEKVHLVARLESVISRDGYVRELQVNPSKQVVAKSRIGGLPVKVPFNKVPKIIAEWVGSDAMASDLSKKAEQAELPDESEVETEEVEETDVVEDDEAVEVE